MLEYWEAASIILKTYGLEAMCVVQWLAIWRLWARNNKREDDHREDDRAQIKMLEKFKASVDALSRVIERLDDKKRLNGED